MNDSLASRFLTASDGHRIAYQCWEPDIPPLGIVHICHGMAEHSRRYHEFAGYLASAGWIVAVHDHRGHGRSIDERALQGHFADRNGLSAVIDDVGLMQQHLRETWPQLPLVLMGHSMGSLTVQCYLSSKPVFWPAAVILSGLSRDPKIKLNALRTVAAFERWRVGARKTSALIDFVTFGIFSRSVKQRTTEFDWLSRDGAEVRDYMEDPLCGFSCTTGLWCDVGSGLAQLAAPDCFSGWPDSLPVYIVSGDRDPAGDFGRGPKRLARVLSAAGLTRVTLRLYPKMRHEPLHESGRDEVMADLKTWLTRAAGS